MILFHNGAVDAQSMDPSLRPAKDELVTRFCWRSAYGRTCQHVARSTVLGANLNPGNKRVSSEANRSSASASLEARLKVQRIGAKSFHIPILLVGLFSNQME